MWSPLKWFEAEWRPKHLCCTVNPRIRCACGMPFCKEHYGDPLLKSQCESLGEGHIRRVGEMWSGKGFCTALNKVVVEDKRFREPWHLKVEDNNG